MKYLTLKQFEKKFNTYFKKIIDKEDHNNVYYDIADMSIFNKLTEYISKGLTGTSLYFRYHKDYIKDRFKDKKDWDTSDYSMNRIIGFNKFSNGMPFCGAILRAEKEDQCDYFVPKIFFIIYYEKNRFKVYVPIKGNLLRTEANIIAILDPDKHNHKEYIKDHFKIKKDSDIIDLNFNVQDILLDLSERFKLKTDNPIKQKNNKQRSINQEVIFKELVNNCKTIVDVKDLNSPDFVKAVNNVKVLSSAVRLDVSQKKVEIT